MTARDDDLASFARLVDAVRPWHRHLVVVGGWAHRLHRLLPDARVPAHASIRTLDADLAFDTRTRLQGDIGAALVAAGFREELATEHGPPVSWYRLGEEGGFYTKFITPLLGSANRRDGTPDAAEPRAGVTAQKLRHVDLLVTAPVPLVLAPGGEIPVAAAASVLVAHPACFIAQKLLIASRRTPAKRAQDVLYVHDTLELFAGSLRALSGHWRSHVSRSLHPRTSATLEIAIGEQYGHVTDVVRQAALIPQDRRLDPERMRMLCELGLKRIFGSA